MCSAFGIMISIFLKREHAAFYSLIGVLGSAILSGYLPVYGFLNSFWYSAIIVALSPLRYAFELFYLVELFQYATDNIDVSSTLNYYGFSFSDIWFCVVLQIIFGLLFYLLGYIFLVLKDPVVTDYFKIITRRLWRQGKKRIKKSKKKQDINSKTEISNNLQESLMEDDEENLEEIDDEPKITFDEIANEQQRNRGYTDISNEPRGRRYTDINNEPSK